MIKAEIATTIKSSMRVIPREEGRLMRAWVFIKKALIFMAYLLLIPSLEKYVTTSFRIGSPRAIVRFR